jgi:hypothetical protein
MVPVEVRPKVLKNTTYNFNKKLRDLVKNLFPAKGVLGYESDRNIGAHRKNYVILSKK